MKSWQTIAFELAVAAAVGAALAIAEVVVKQRLAAEAAPPARGPKQLKSKAHRKKS